MQVTSPFWNAEVAPRILENSYNPVLMKWGMRDWTRFELLRIGSS